MSGQDPRLVPLTFQQACEAAQRSPRTVRYWIARGWLKPVMVGSDGRYRYTEQDVLEAEAKARGNAA